MAVRGLLGKEEDNTQSYHQREAGRHQPQRPKASEGQGAGRHTEQNGDGEEREYMVRGAWSLVT